MPEEQLNFTLDGKSHVYDGDPENREADFFEVYTRLRGALHKPSPSELFECWSANFPLSPLTAEAVFKQYEKELKHAEKKAKKEKKKKEEDGKSKKEKKAKKSGCDENPFGESFGDENQESSPSGTPVKRKTSESAHGPYAQAATTPNAGPAHIRTVSNPFGSGESGQSSTGRDKGKKEKKKKEDKKAKKKDKKGDDESDDEGGGKDKKKERKHQRQRSAGSEPVNDSDGDFAPSPRKKKKEGKDKKEKKKKKDKKGSDNDDPASPKTKKEKKEQKRRRSHDDPYADASSASDSGSPTPRGSGARAASPPDTLEQSALAAAAAAEPCCPSSPGTRRFHLYVKGQGMRTVDIPTQRSTYADLVERIAVGDAVLSFVDQDGDVVEVCDDDSMADFYDCLGSQREGKAITMMCRPAGSPRTVSRSASAASPQPQSSAPPGAPQAPQPLAPVGGAAAQTEPTHAPEHVLLGHAGPVHSCAFSPCGQKAASASSDGTVRAWEVSAEREIWKTEDHGPGKALCCDWGATGLVVSSGDDMVCRLWDAATGAPRGTLAGHESHVYSVAFSPDGSHVVSASNDTTLRVWCVDTCQVVRKLQGHAKSVFGCGFSPDGVLVCSGSDDTTVKIWDWNGPLQEQEVTLRGHSGCIWDVCFSPNQDTLLSAGSDMELRMWSIQKHATLWLNAQAHPEPIHRAVFTGDGRRCVSCSRDLSIRLWAAENGRLLGTMRNVHAGFVYCVAVRGPALASAGQDGAMKLWRLPDDAPSPVCELSGHKGNVTCCAFDPTGARLLTTSSDSTLRTWDLEQRLELFSFLEPSGAAWWCDWSPDGRLIASAGLDDVVLVREAELVKKKWTIGSPKEVKHALKGHTRKVTCVAFSTDSKFLLSASADCTAVVWKLDGGKKQQTLSGHELPVLCCSFSSPDGRCATGSEDHTVSIWDWKAKAAEERRVCRLEGHESPVCSVDFVPGEAARLVSGAADGELRLWALTERSALWARPAAHVGGVLRAVAAGGAGEAAVVASCSRDGCIKLWRAAEGLLCGELQLPCTATVNCIAAAKGKLATALQDGSVRIWQHPAIAPPPQQQQAVEDT